jgi:hypothetical protein
MNEPADSANTVVRPPIAWALAFVAGLGTDRLYPLWFVPVIETGLRSPWLGAAVLDVSTPCAVQLSLRYGDNVLDDFARISRPDEPANRLRLIH